MPKNKKMFGKTVILPKFSVTLLNNTCGELKDSLVVQGG